MTHSHASARHTLHKSHPQPISRHARTNDSHPALPLPSIYQHFLVHRGLAGRGDEMNVPGLIPLTGRHMLEARRQTPDDRNTYRVASDACVRCEAAQVGNRRRRSPTEPFLWCGTMMENATEIGFRRFPPYGVIWACCSRRAAPKKAHRRFEGSGEVWSGV